ncbi:MAG: hypothetical protein IPG70_14165 [Moraxellaceae bacterium]|nr:hypothetical protein [Moraxellaceae bacterium]
MMENPQITNPILRQLATEATGRRVMYKLDKALKVSDKIGGLLAKKQRPHHKLPVKNLTAEAIK